MRARSAMVPAVNIGSNLGVWLVMIASIILSVWFHFTGLIWLIWMGVGLFSLSALFALFTLPVELNASSRAMQMLTASGLMDRTEYGQARVGAERRRWTYVAGLATAVMQLLLLHHAGGSPPMSAAATGCGIIYGGARHTLCSSIRFGGLLLFRNKDRIYLVWNRSRCCRCARSQGRRAKRGPRNIYDLTLDDLAATLEGWGRPRFRAKQIMHWLYKELVTDFTR